MPTIRFLFVAALLNVICFACSPSETQVASPYQTRFVQVSDNTKLEVLDWGGTGKPVLFLTGLGFTAHVYADFAPRFTDQFRVYGLTRRGFGQSSKPKSGYDPKTLANDILVVLDSLNIRKAILIGHSVAGNELSTFAPLYPDRVEKIVYLDAAYDHTSMKVMSANAPEIPRATAEDSTSLMRVQKRQKAIVGLSIPAEEIKQGSRFSKEGKYLGDKTPDFVYEGIVRQIDQPDYRHIQCPALALYAEPIYVEGVVPYYSRLDSTNRKKAVALFSTIQRAIKTEGNRFKSEVPRGTLKSIKGAHHNIFISNPTETERMIREFLK